MGHAVTQAQSANASHDLTCKVSRTFASRQMVRETTNASAEYP